MVWRAGQGDPYLLLEGLLAETEGVEPLPAVGRREGGKPWFPAYPQLHFSLSRSGNVSLCALGEGPVGADVERVRPRSPGLPRYALSDREYAWYRDRGGHWEDFYALWTLKEARVKCTGEGIFRRPAREVEVPLLSLGREVEWDGFRYWALHGEDQIEGDFRGALCLKIL